MLKEKFINQINTIKFDSSKPIVVAMSGGVDSSFAAAILSLMGYEVIGITLRLYDTNNTMKAKSCCASRDIEDARLVSEKIGFKHYVLNYISRFKEAVIDKFIESYMHGETPLPCVMCNKEIKFKDLLQLTKQFGAQALVTGHYVIKKNGYMYRALDKNKDQSYFMFNISSEDLQYLEFPLGFFTKNEVRACAEEIGLHISSKSDSQDICFVHNNDYRALLPQGRNGKIIHKDGTILAEHNGIANFTIGQRKGIKANYNGAAMYVIEFRENDVIVGSASDLLCNTIELRDMNLFDSVSRCKVKIRYAQLPIDALVEGNTVRFDNPISRPAPGQACVFYDDERLLGGGWICNNK